MCVCACLFVSCLWLFAFYGLGNWRWPIILGGSARRIYALAAGVAYGFSRRRVLRPRVCLPFSLRALRIISFGVYLLLPPKTLFFSLNFSIAPSFSLKLTFTHQLFRVSFFPSCCVSFDYSYLATAAQASAHAMSGEAATLVRLNISSATNSAAAVAAKIAYEWGHVVYFPNLLLQVCVMGVWVWCVCMCDYNRGKEQEEARYISEIFMNKSSKATQKTRWTFSFVVWWRVLLFFFGKDFFTIYLYCFFLLSQSSFHCVYRRLRKPWASFHHNQNKKSTIIRAFKVAWRISWEAKNKEGVTKDNRWAPFQL